MLEHQPRVVLTGLLLAVSLQGCGAARSAGREFASGALAGLQAEDSVLIALQRDLVDTAFVTLAAEFREAVLDPATATWTEMRAGVRSEADSVRARLEATLETSLRQTVPSAIAENGDLLEARIRRLAEAFTDEFTRGLGTGARSAVAPAADSLMRGIVRAAVRGLEDDFRPAAHRLMMELRDSLQLRIGDVDEAVASSSTVEGLRFALLGAGGSLFLGLTVVGVGSWRRRSRAFDVLIDAIEAGGHDATKRAVGSCARDAGVHGWLNDRLRGRWTAVAGEDSEVTHGEPR